MCLLAFVCLLVPLKVNCLSLTIVCYVARYYESCIFLSCELCEWWLGAYYSSCAFKGVSLHVELSSYFHPQRLHTLIRKGVWRCLHELVCARANVTGTLLMQGCGVVH